MSRAGSPPPALATCASRRSGPKTADQAKAQIADLTKGGASSLIVDVRRTSGGSLDGGLALARLFVAKGTLAHARNQGRWSAKRLRRGQATAPSRCRLSLLVDTGTSSGAELFASALVGNQRAELIGEHTIGRAAQQRLVKLPDGSGLWLTITRYLTPDGTPLHEKGLEPTVAGRRTGVKFGQVPPAGDPVLEKALERFAQKKAA